MLSFATFAVGFLVRPIGGVVFGHIGDRIGRKKTLALTMFIMGIATALMGVLPTAAQIGVVATDSASAASYPAGICSRGEWAGAVLLAVEHSPEKKRGLFGSIRRSDWLSAWLWAQECSHYFKRPSTTNSFSVSAGA